jgi:hypothetical protein
MKRSTRRDALRLTAEVGLLAGLAPASAAADESRDEKERKADRERVIAAGMTADEAECWETVAEAAGKFFALPELHPMDKQEVATAIHVIQHKLLARPTYRRYKELARKGSGAPPAAKQPDRK